MQYQKYDHNEYPKSLPVDDYWGQVRRTVNGKPVSEEQIKMIVDAIQSGLMLEKTDNILDIACGNGALSSRLYDSCEKLHGIDFSPYLIQVAQTQFQIEKKSTFSIADAASYVQAETNFTRYNKALCYGSFSYFSPNDAYLVLHELHKKFTTIKKVFIGNLPDRDKAHLFYPLGNDFSKEINHHQSQIGIWRSEKQICELAESAGWKCMTQRMPTDFYASHYRYDVILYR
jgi:cyclopropane fatty-acyl-phospholipid synthase-like methyltransferase